MPDSENTFEKWRDVHQAFELDYHSKDNYRWHDGQFLPAWKQNFRGFLGLDPDHFLPGDILLDVGCGSRSALGYFETGVHHYIEPLGKEYLKIPQVQQYWTEGDLTRLYSVPAESLVGRLAGNCSFVNCWNVLDHCHEWREVLGNLINYAKPGAIISLCTDLKSHGVGHPGVDDPAELMLMLMDTCILLRMEVNYGLTVKRDIALKLLKK